MQLCLAREKREYARAMQASAMRIINTVIYSALAPGSFEGFWRGKPGTARKRRAPALGGAEAKSLPQTEYPPWQVPTTAGADTIENCRMGARYDRCARSLIIHAPIVASVLCRQSLNFIALVL
jgi:hypothetical protein